MLNKLLSILATLFFVSLFTVVQARPVTIEFTAIIDYVDDYGNALNGDITTGQTITGSYSFDTNLNDNDPNPEFANFTYQAPIPPGIGFDLKIGNLNYSQASNTASEFNLHIYNGFNSDGFAAVTCCGNAGTLSNGANVSDIFVDLYSPSTNVLSVDTLEAATSAINAFSDKKFNIYGSGSNGNWYSINATITSINEKTNTGSCDAPKVAGDTVGFKARVNYVYEDMPSSNSPYKVGDIVEASYKIDLSLPDLDPSPEYARYEHDQYGTDTGVTLKHNGKLYQSNMAYRWLQVYVENFQNYSGSDHFAVVSTNSDIRLPDGSIIHDIGMAFNDPNGTILSSTILPEVIPTTLSGWTSTDVFMYGTKPDGSYFYVNAVIEELTNTSLSEGSTTTQLQVSPASGSLVMYQNFDAGMVIEAGFSPIQFVDANVADMYGSIQNVNCHPGPVGPDNRQTVLCPNVSSRLSPGNNTFTVNIQFSDGIKLFETINWEVVGY